MVTVSLTWRCRSRHAEMMPAAIMRMSEPTSIIVLAVLACARWPSSYMRMGVVVIQSMYRAMGTAAPLNFISP